MRSRHMFLSLGDLQEVVTSSHDDFFLQEEGGLIGSGSLGNELTYVSIVSSQRIHGGGGVYGEWEKEGPTFPLL